MAIGGLTRFAGIWFDNLFTDLSVRERIRQVRYNVDQASRRVDELRDGLRGRAAQHRNRLAVLAGERRDLLAQP
ncbi:hypothetical protein [Plantactinospora sonchi]|uniref:Uncharacterized protein n=1 Tax=Plantactinospora sonchi TaxID=1544735 RepID=A0ABU7RZ58_9ACTN